MYVTGNFSGTVDFDPGASTANLSSAGGADIFALKLSSSGSYIWAKAWGSSNDEAGISIAADAAGNVFTNGQYTGTVDMNPGTGVNNLTSAGNNDVFLTKFDQAGNFTWAKNVMSGLNDDWASSIKLNSSGDVFVTGQFSSTSNADATTTLTSNGGGDIFLTKVNTAGTLVWARSFGDVSDDVGRSIGTDTTGHVYLVGGFQGTVDFDPAAANTAMLSSAGGSDIFILDLDASGNYVWAGGIGDAGYDDAYGIYSDQGGNLAVTGAFKLSPDFDPSPKTSVISSSGSNDIFVLKLFPCVLPNTPVSTTQPANRHICSNASATLTAVGTGTLNWYAGATSTTSVGTGTAYVTPALSAGTYTYYAEALTCSSSLTRAQVTVTVNPVPVITANNGVICAGKSFTIVSSGANTYIYSGGSAVVTPASTTFYSVIGFDALGCMSMPAVSVVTVMPAPPVTAASSNSAICSGGSATLTASGASNFTWSTGAVTPSIVVSPTVTATYSVTSTGSNGCVGTAVLTQTVNVCTGIEDLNAASASLLNVHPNPSTGIFTIEAAETLSITVCDLLGNALISMKAEPGKQVIDLGSYAGGVYILRAVRDGHVENIRLVKQ